MAYAYHTNTDVRNAHLLSTPALPLLLGSFGVVGEPVTFEYAVRPDEGIDFAPDCPHIVYVTKRIPNADQGYRYAKILKTVAWVCVDEDETGQPVYEKWPLKQHRTYDTTWVYA